MKRIKIFVEEYSYDVLEKRVNDFLATLMPEKVLDIQYRDTDNYGSVLVIYLDEPAIMSEDNSSTDWPSRLSWSSGTNTTF